jgi:voltage-gated potassium channel
MRFASLRKFIDPVRHGESAGLSHVRHFDAVRFAFLVLTIPAFYLHLAATQPTWWWLGSALYLLGGIGLAGLLTKSFRRGAQRISHPAHRFLDIAIVIGVFASLLGTAAPWSSPQWALRLALVALIAMRLLLCVAPLLTRRDTGFVLLLGAVTLLLSGLGFYWLEPTVKSYADGLWLAFESGATVGYGDIVPTTAAARVFAVFMVLVGYAILSLVTASIAAFFIGEDEQQLRRELHRDIKALRDEVRQLRESLQQQLPKS